MKNQTWKAAVSAAAIAAGAAIPMAVNADGEPKIVLAAGETHSVTNSYVYRFRHYRFKIDNCMGKRNGLQISEFRLLNGNVDVTSLRSGFSYGEGMDSSTLNTQWPTMAVDGDLKTKWYTENGSSSSDMSKCWIQLDFADPQPITAYDWATANDRCLTQSVNDRRDPMTFRLLGSDDGETWTQLDSRNIGAKNITRRSWTGPYYVPVPKNVPELMKTFGGADVKSVEDWEKVRAPELLECFMHEEYGRRPAAAEERARVSFETYRESEAFGGKAICRHVRVKYDGPNGKHSFPITIYIPKADRPVPAFVYIGINFHTKYDAEGAVRTSEYWPVERIIDRGYATAAFPVIKLAADKKGAGFSQGVFPAVQPASARGGDSWATISAWAWGASRVLDWMETEPLIDAKHVGVVGHSRGGKTALWTGATDKRFAMACSNESGCSGAKLNHIDLPKSEHIDFMIKCIDYWFCDNYRKYAGKDKEMPFDQHEMLALIAPRLLCVGSATEDHWCGPVGEWWSAKLASPAWEMYGKKGLVGDKWPNPEKPQQEGCVSYHLRTGTHFLTPYDWDRYMDFADRHGWGAKVAVAATNIYVSPGGDDSADGSLERPFATVVRARDAVRAMKKAGALPKGGVTVWLRGGTYRMERPLSLDTKDSGEEGAPVSYRAWKDETPVLFGGWTVPASAWRKADDPRIPDAAKGKVWCADVRLLGYDALDPDAPCGFHTPRPLFRIRSLYRNGKQLPLARYPNGGFIKTGNLARGKKVAFTANVGEWTRWSPENAPDLRALGYWKWLWADETLPVVVNPAAKVIAFDSRPQGQARNVSFHLSEVSASNTGAGELYDFLVRKGMPFCLLNALAALDAPGEWYFDRGSGILYVRPPEDKDPRGDKYELAAAAFPLLSAEKASHLRFEGIVFRCGRHHGVELENVSDVAFEGCFVRDFGGNGLILKGARNCVVHGNVFHTFGHCAMLLDGGDRRTLTESGVTVEANDFSDTGLAMRTYTPGIWVTGCGHRIVRNVLHDIPSSAMRVGGNEHLVASNLVERVVLESDDQGAVDMWGDPTYRGNKFIHNIWRDIGCGGEFVKCGQAGIRFDDAISGNLVYGNRFDNCSRGMFGGMQIHGGRGNVVRNNVFTRCQIGVSIFPWPQEKWRSFLTNATGQAKAKSANADGAAFRERYPEYATETDAPNVVECNVYEGDESAFTRKVPSAGAGVVKGNVCVKKLPTDLSAIPGFEPLPPESAIGPGDDAVLKQAMTKERP